MPSQMPGQYTAGVLSILHPAFERPPSDANPPMHEPTRVLIVALFPPVRATPTPRYSSFRNSKFVLIFRGKKLMKKPAQFPSSLSAA